MRARSARSRRQAKSTTIGDPRLHRPGKAAVGVCCLNPQRFFGFPAAPKPSPRRQAANLGSVLTLVRHQPKPQRGHAQKFDDVAVTTPICDLRQRRQKLRIPRLTVRFALCALQIARRDADRVVGNNRLSAPTGAPQIDRSGAVLGNFEHGNALGTAHRRRVEHQRRVEGKRIPGRCRRHDGEYNQNTKRPGQADYHQLRSSARTRCTLDRSHVAKKMGPQKRGPSWFEQPLLNDHPGKHIGLQHHQNADQAGKRNRVEEHEAQDAAFMPVPVGSCRGHDDRLSVDHLAHHAT